MRNGLGIALCLALSILLYALAALVAYDLAQFAKLHHG